jgi:hypothetical protein
LTDDEKKRRARLKFTPDRGPLSEDTKEKLRQRMKEWHLKTRRGTLIGNALARKARVATAKKAAVIWVWLVEWAEKFLHLVG